MRATLLLFVILLAGLVADAKDRFSYVYQYGANGSVAMMSGSVDDLVRVKKRVGSGRYLWSRVDGREYVIRDAKLLDLLDAALEPHRALDRKQETLRQEMKPFEDRVDRLEDQVDALSDREDELIRAEQDRLRELERQLREAERALRVFEERERELERGEPAIDRLTDDAVRGTVERAVREGKATRLR